jgi:PAS domain S-box-containing protein
MMTPYTQGLEPPRRFIIGLWQSRYLTITLATAGAVLLLWTLLQTRGSSISAHESYLRHRPILIAAAILVAAAVVLAALQMAFVARARRRARAELINQRSQLLSIFDSIDEPIYVSDPQTYELLYTNGAFKARWGESHGRKCHEVLQGLTTPCEFCTNVRIMGANLGRPYIWEFQNQTDGRWYRCIDKAIRWPDGRLVRYEMAIDITERKAAEDALRRERDFAEGLIETAQAIILVLDSEARIIRYNPFVEKLTGYPLEEVVGRDWISVFLPKSDQERIRAAFRQAIGDMQTRGYVNTILTRDGHPREIEWYDRTLKNDRGEITGLLAVGLDITERRRSAEVAQQRQAEVEHIHRLHTMGEFAAGLAHELNQPLCAISSCAQAAQRLLQTESPDLANSRTAIEEVVVQAERAAEVIRRLRLFVRKHEPQRAALDVNALIRETLALVRPEARQHDMTVVLELDERLPPIQADRVQIQQVLLNLQRNAIDAIREVRRERRELVISTVLRDNQLEVAVRDTGRGLPEKDPERVFESFYTTKQTGLGLGLPLSRSFIEAHGGRLWAAANTEGGATFRFTLPVTGEA